MKKSHFVLVVFVLVVVIFGFLGLLPQRAILFREIGEFLAGTWYVVYNIFLIVWMLAGSALLGFLAKAYLVTFIDRLFWPDESMEVWMRHTFFALFAVMVFLLWVVMIPVLMQPWNFLWVFAESMFAWPGVYETPPLWWGIWAVVPFWIAWGSTDHTDYQ